MFKIFNTNLPLMEDIGAIYIIEAISAAAQIANVSAAIEAKLGISLSGQFKAGIGGVTVRLAFNVKAGFIDHTQIVKEGVFLNLGANDPYKKWIDKLKPLFETNVNTNNSKREDGLRKSLTALPNN